MLEGLELPPEEEDPPELEDAEESELPLAGRLGGGELRAACMGSTQLFRTPFLEEALHFLQGSFF